jgi:hypothetical protein
MDYNGFLNFLEWNAREGDSPVYVISFSILVARLGRVGLLGIAT